MKCYIVRQIVMALLALGVLLYQQAPVVAEGMTGYIVIFPSVGLAPGERLRLTLFNPDDEPILAQAQIHHSGGILVGLGDGSVRSGGFHSFDFQRAEIPLPGEAGTGRLQLRASLHISLDHPWKKVDGLAVSVETISISDGASNTILVAEVILPRGDGGGRDILVGGHTGDVLMGIVPGQKLRVTIFNPYSFEAGAGSHENGIRANGHIKIFDNRGSVIDQSDELAIQPGEFRSFDFDGDALTVPREPGTDRVQVRAKPFFEFNSQRLTRVLSSFELVNKTTGKTELLSGEQCLVFFLGGMPGN